MKCRPQLIASTLVVATLLALGAAKAPAQDTAERIQVARETLAQWVETKRVASKEKQDLALAKEVLGERILLVEREIEGLRTRIKDAETNISEADKKRSELVAENDRLKSATASLQDVVVRLENELRGLLPSLPEPVLERIKPLTQRLPAEGAETKLTRSERFQNVVGILNEIERFNSEITTTSEVRTLPDGSSAEVAVIYLGIGQAYYVGMGGTVAGIGSGVSGTWTWTAANEAAPEIARAVAILKNEQIAAYVKLPLQID